jgi:CDP-glucose 4,6-dehydratase
MDTGWRGRRVLVTGHTGFKGAWLALWLEQLGATTFGIALPPPHGGAFCALRPRVEAEHYCDIRDRDQVLALTEEWQPEVVFHLAAQALVPDGYRDPLGTFETNVGGTMNVVSAAIDAGADAVVVVTSDKVYANDGSGRAFAESDALGGRDPYSASKACADIAARSLHALPETEGTALAVARAGNVIGGERSSPIRRSDFATRMGFDRGSSCSTRCSATCSWASSC